MKNNKLDGQLATLKEQNENLPVVFHFIKPHKREFYVSSYKKSRIINLDKYGTRAFVITPFYKSISRVY